MTDNLSDADWDDLADLITEAPAERIRVAMRRVVDAASASVAASLAGVDRLLHLASISSGDAFDRALLSELRRLSVH
jgi:hypothetical protein